VPKNPQKKFGKLKKGKRSGKNMKNRAKCQEKDKGKTFTCHKCGGPNHFARKCQTPKQLVELYKKLLKESNNNKRSYEAHFNDMAKEGSTSGTIHSNSEMPKETTTMTWTWRTRSWNTTPMMCLETLNRLINL
jgi:hypothetical protein